MEKGEIRYKTIVKRQKTKDKRQKIKVKSKYTNSK